MTAYEKELRPILQNRDVLIKHKLPIVEELLVLLIGKYLTHFHREQYMWVYLEQIKPLKNVEHRKKKFEYFCPYASSESLEEQQEAIVDCIREIRFWLKDYVPRGYVLDRITLIVFTVLLNLAVPSQCF